MTFLLFFYSIHIDPLLPINLSVKSQNCLEMDGKKSISQILKRQTKIYNTLFIPNFRLESEIMSVLSGNTDPIIPGHTHWFSCQKKNELIMEKKQYESLQ